MSDDTLTKSVKKNGADDAISLTWQLTHHRGHPVRQMAEKDLQGVTIYSDPSQASTTPGQPYP